MFQRPSTSILPSHNKPKIQQGVSSHKTGSGFSSLERCNKADSQVSSKICVPSVHCPQKVWWFKGELQRENKLISYEKAFKMLENDMYVAGIGQAVLELLSFKVESGNHQRGISLLQKFSDIFGNMKLVSRKMTSHLTSHNFQVLKIEIL